MLSINIKYQENNTRNSDKEKQIAMAKQVAKQFKKFL